MQCAHCTDEKSKGQGCRNLTMVPQLLIASSGTLESVLSIASTEAPTQCQGFPRSRVTHHQHACLRLDLVWSRLDTYGRSEIPSIRRALASQTLGRLCPDSGASGQGRPPDNPQLDSR